MSLILAADDVAPGVYAAVHSGRCAGSVGAEHGTVCGGSPVPAGLPLRVIGVSLPFAACAIVQPGGGEDGPVVLDLRHVRLSRLDSSFVESIASFNPAREEQEDDDVLF